jgi:phenylalanyl-tRNA synthetase alpha subunit
LLGLHEKFIEGKYDIYQEEKLHVSVNKAAAKEQRKHQLKSIREDHQLVALQMLFTEEQVAQLETK